MSCPREEVFDAIAGAQKPYVGFGPVIGPNEGAVRDFTKVWEQAVSRFADVFGQTPRAEENDINLLEGTIGEMWSQKWNPGVGNVSLFTRDFGAILAMTFIKELKAELVLRSQTELFHASCWWPAICFEAFPFHKIQKRLTEPEGESLPFFYYCVKERVQPLAGQSHEGEP